MRNAALALGLLMAATTAGRGDPAIVDGAMATPLADASGEPARGRAIVVDRRKGLCLLCHSGPFPEERFQGDLAPSLAGAGARNTPAQLRARLADSRQVAPGSLMPPYFSLVGLTRVAPQQTGRTILTWQDIEDVVAFLVTLKE